MKLECVNNIIVDTSECLKPCSGLIVSSFSKHIPHQDNEIIENLHLIMRDYNRYKKITRYPAGFDGRLQKHNY